MYASFIYANIWMFPKIVGFTPKSSILIGFSIIFTIHFGVLVVYCLFVALASSDSCIMNEALHPDMVNIRVIKGSKHSNWCEMNSRSANISKWYSKCLEFQLFKVYVDWTGSMWTPYLKKVSKWSHHATSERFAGFITGKGDTMWHVRSFNPPDD